MPDAPLAVVPAFTPGTPTAPSNIVGSGAVSPPSAPAEIQADGQPGAPSAPAVITLKVPPVPIAATATLNPTGSNNDILATAKSAGAAGNDLTAEIVIAANSTALTAVETDGAVVITSGAIHTMIFEFDGLDRDGVAFPSLVRAPFEAMTGGKPSYVGVGAIGAFWYDNQWHLVRDSSVPSFLSSEDVVTPDLVVTWTPQGSATGTPTVTAASATAAQAIALSQTALSVTLTDGPGSDGTGTLAAVAETALTGGLGISAPTAPPAITPPGQPSAPSAPSPVMP